MACIYLDHVETLTPSGRCQVLGTRILLSQDQFQPQHAARHRELASIAGVVFNDVDGGLGRVGQVRPAIDALAIGRGLGPWFGVSFLLGGHVPLLYADGPGPGDQIVSAPQTARAAGQGCVVLRAQSAEHPRQIHCGQLCAGRR